MNASPCITIDTREPWPHPWAPFWPADVTLTRACLETGDVALAGAPEGAVVERKTVPDLLACIGRDRARFDRELLRARYVGVFAVVVEGTLADVLRQARGLYPVAILGTLAAWTRRGWPVVFCGNQPTAAEFALRFVTQPLAEAERLLKANSRAQPTLNGTSRNGALETFSPTEPAFAGTNRLAQLQKTNATA